MINIQIRISAMILEDSLTGFPRVGVGKDQTGDGLFADVL